MKYIFFLPWSLVAVLLGCSTPDTAPRSAAPSNEASANTLTTEGPSEALGEPQKDEQGDQSLAQQCLAAKENVLKLQGSGGAAPQTIVLLQAKSKEFLRKCEEYPAKLVKCLVDAKSNAELASCRFENEASVRPDPSMMDLCDTAYKNARLIISAAGAPPPALAKFDESRPEALIQCSREPRVVVECLVTAKTMGEMRACRESVDGSVPQAPEEVKKECRSIHKQVFELSIVPEFFTKKWKGDISGFVVECARMPAEVRQCMKSANQFEDFQRCAKTQASQISPQ